MFFYLLIRIGNRKITRLLHLREKMIFVQIIKYTSENTT